MGVLQSTEHFGLGDLLAAAFHHHHRSSGTGHHQLKISFCQIVGPGVDQELAPHPRDANSTNGSQEGKVRNCQGR